MNESQMLNENHGQTQEKQMENIEWLSVGSLVKEAKGKKQTSERPVNNFHSEESSTCNSVA